MACLPRKIKSGFSFFASARKVCAAVSGSTAASVCTRIGAIGAHGERGAQLLLGVGHAHADRDDFDIAPRSLMRSASSSAISSKGIDAHFHAVEHDAAAVGLDADAHVVIDDALDTNHDLLHFALLKRFARGRELLRRRVSTPSEKCCSEKEPLILAAHWRSLGKNARRRILRAQPRK
jgi:hypothetical protein